MVCGLCGSEKVEWKGRLSALTHTECGSCGAINMHVVPAEESDSEEDDPVAMYDICPDCKQAYSVKYGCECKERTSCAQPRTSVQQPSCEKDGSNIIEPSSSQD